MEAHIFITDKTGLRFWNTSVTYGYHRGEQRNLERHLAAIKARHPHYCRVDSDTARLVMSLDGKEIDLSEKTNQNDIDLLNDLGSFTP